MTPKEETLLSQLEEWLSRPASFPVAGSTLKPYKFRMSEVEGFRYRVKVRSVVVTGLRC